MKALFVPLTVYAKYAFETLACLAFFFVVNPSYPSRYTWEEYLIDITAAEDDDSDYDDAYDVLSDITDNPFDINRITREDLEQLPFLTDVQIEDICEFVDRYKPLRTLNELALITSMDTDTRELLTQFVRINDDDVRGLTKSPKLKDMLTRGKHKATAYVKIPFYERAGDKNGYLGYKYKHWIRYDYSYTDYLRVGFTGAQDAGEPFFADNNKMGYDYYSFYFMMKKIGRVEAMAVGNYKLSAGMGLVLSTSFSLGKSSMMTSISRRSNIIRPHTSRSESDYFRGAAATVRIMDGLSVMVFASYRPMDATLNSDGSASTLITSGYHRTETEMSKKGNTKATATGGSLRYDAHGFHCGTTVAYTHLSRRLSPKTSTIYKRYYPAGTDFINASIDYGYICRKFSFYGETAVDKAGAVATVNKLSLTIWDKITLTALQRFYSYKYSSLYANSFSDGGYVRNESGIYLGATYKPVYDLTISVYTDYAYFPWPKYRISQPSHSWDNMLTATYSKGRWMVMGRYRLRMRQRNSSNDSNVLTGLTEQKARLKVSYSDDDGNIDSTPEHSWAYTLQTDFSFVNYEGTSMGYMINGNAEHTWKKIRAYASLAYFNTDDYSSRLCTYEKSMRYSSYFPSFYGEGIRYTLMCTYNFSPSLLLTAKVGISDYFDRSTISSSYQLINHSSMTDLELQVHWTFR